MFKKIVLLILVIFTSAFQSNVTYAGDFRTLAETGWLKLGPDQAWEKSYDTENGKFKIRFRRLLFGSDAKRYHLIIWWNGKRIADGYTPEGTQYGFKIFEDGETKRIFVMLATPSRAVLLGYEPNNNKIEKYVDSKDYYSYLSYPTMDVDGEGNLRLSFSENGNGVGPIRYTFTWNNSINWFGYSNTSIQVANNEYYSDEDDEFEEYSTENVAPYPQESVNSENTGELYYETHEVVGS